MVQNKKQNSPMFSQINSSKKGIQILLSLSVLAFISSQYSSLISTYLSSFKLFSSTPTDRHFIFLLCNGLMLLVIKTSGLFSSPAPPGTEFYRDSHVIRIHVQPSHHQFADLSENILVKNKLISHQPVVFTRINNVEPEIDDLPETKGETNTKFGTEVEEAKNDTSSMDQGGEHVTSTTYYEEKEQLNDLDLMDEQEQDYEELEFVNIGAEEEEQETMLWSTEELNKKCDDFIRKMKHGIRFEAPLVMV